MEKFEITTLRKAVAVTGARLFISLEDARGILQLTEYISTDKDGTLTLTEEEVYRVNAESRQFLRSLAKKILMYGGEVTEASELVKTFTDTSIYAKKL